MEHYPPRLRTMGADLRDATRHWTCGARRGNGVELMPVHKRKYRSGRVVWNYGFDLQGSTREHRERATESGFATKAEAQTAEANRRIEEQQKRDLAKAGASIAAAPPKTLVMLLSEFMRHCEGKLAPKTLDRYHQQAAYLDLTLLAMPLLDITPLHLNREWDRLLKGGGHHRKTKLPRPLSAKTVHNIAGVLSSAFARAIKWGLISTNPVTSGQRAPARQEVSRGGPHAAAQQNMVRGSSLWTLVYADIPRSRRRYRMPTRRASGVAMVKHREWLRADRSVAHANTGWPTVQGDQNGEASACRNSGVCGCHARGASVAAGCIPASVRYRLPFRPGPRVRESRWNTVEARFDLGDCLGTL